MRISHSGLVPLLIVSFALAASVARATCQDPGQCDDGNPCTLDSCDAGTCTHVPDDTSTCDDGNPCTPLGVCRSGACVPCGAATAPCSGTTTGFASATALPIPLRPDVGSSEIYVSGLDPILERVRVQTFLHAEQDLDVIQATLRSPIGTVITLTSNNGSAGPELDALYGTWWEDDADPGNTIPFPGARFPASNLVADAEFSSSLLSKPYLAPEEPLGALRRENPNGGWVLSLTGDTAERGVLDGWVLEVTTLPEVRFLRLSEFGSSAGLPIPDVTEGGAVSSTVVVSGMPGRIGRVRLQTSFSHPSPGQLQITLESPSGKVVTISNQRGGSITSAFQNVLWDDRADPGNPLPFPLGPMGSSNLVTDALLTSPRSTLVPEEPLATFAGEDPNGPWRLTVQDLVYGGFGSLTHWGIEIESVECPATCAPPCDDHDPCTIDGCDATTGCTHTPVSCDDQVVCTVDSCDPASGACVHAPASCDDHDPCTTDSCSGVCQHAPISCDDGDACTVDSCVSATGQCGHSPASCDDGIPCTVDSCDPASGCVHAPDSSVCPPATGQCVAGPQQICFPGTGCRPQYQLDTPCRVGCSAGRCFGGPECVIIVFNDCGVNTNCGASTCNPATGACESHPDVCDDGNACTVDFCGGITGCVHDAGHCSDGNPCTTDFCNAAGACDHAGTTCIDADPCTLDTCDVVGGCAHTAGVGEIRNLRFGTKTSLGWDWLAGQFLGEKFDVVRGTLGSLPVGSTPAAETCVAHDYGQNALLAAASPPLSVGWWYLVRERASCGTGTYGNEGQHGVPAAERVTTKCP